MPARDYRFQAMRSARLVILSLAIACAGCAAVDVGRMPAMPVAEARTQPVGSRVIVAGVVIVSSGALDPGFALQDDSGGISPQDITLQEIRIECFFPGDASTESWARGLRARS